MSNELTLHDAIAMMKEHGAEIGLSFSEVDDALMALLMDKGFDYLEECVEDQFYERATQTGD